MKSVIDQLTTKENKEIDVEKLLAALFSETIDCNELYKKIKDTPS